MRSSNDSLAQRRDHSAGGYQEGSDSHKGHHHQQSGVSLLERPLPVPGHGMVRDYRNGDIYTRHGDMIQRPRSASETTVSHRRGNDWEGDRADSDDESDTRSLQSSLDIWMRESTKPARNTGRGSPDLFGFPISSSKGTWAPQAMFGPNSARPGPQGIGPDAAYMHDLFSLRQALFAANVAPAPPDRRSSLHARTGSTSESAQTASNQALSETDQKSRHSRGHSETAQARSNVHTPVQQLMGPPLLIQGDKRNHYPPIVGQQGGARAGLNRLFRRSIGGTSASGTPEGVPSSTTESTFPDTPKMTTLNMGAPSWVNRTVALDDDDDRSGATPPPIMLNPRQVRRNTAGAEIMPDYLHQAANAKEQVAEICESGRQTPTSQKQQQQPMTPTTPSGTGIRRKWLPAFARTSNLKNKAS
ncbi:hypothetical protein PT974_10745 [Cladobotryum mycophilum]|uniref:Uncharacterized protein n=1 Tax=Cladobotryum mycophilum TaxID=491253 RepID=A0ABR0SBA1_9HYPO